VFIATRILLARFRLRSLKQKLSAGGSRGGAQRRVRADVAAPNPPGVLDVSPATRTDLQPPPVGESPHGGRDGAPPSAPPIVRPAEISPEQPIDEAAIRTEIVEFLDRAEARARGRPDWSSTLQREQERQQDEALAQLASASERFSDELEREHDATRRDARAAFEQAEAAAARRLEQARAEAGRLLESARTDARELVRRAQGEAEQTLEWSRAQGAEIVRRSQRVAAERFGSEPRPWSTAELRRP